MKNSSKMSTETLAKSLETLNRRVGKKLIFHIGHSAGFYSEFNNMVFAILHCLKNNIGFKLYSEDANFREKLGWNDYFVPFCDEVRFRPLHYINGRDSNPELGIKSKFYLPIFRFLFKNTYLTQDLWNSIRTIDKEFSTFKDDNNVSPTFFEACRNIINNVYVFNEETVCDIEKLKSTLLINGNYLSLHIRGGDKITECELTNIDKYMEIAKNVSNIKKIFVSTDDYRFFELLKKNYTDYTFFTISNESAKGYLQRDFVYSSADQRRSQMINMFASMDLLLGGKHCICTFSSNIGMFIGIMMGNRAHSADLDNWQIW